MRPTTQFLMLALAAAPAFGQCTPSPTNFCVTVGNKTAANPNPGGHEQCFYVNGLESPALTLVRGTSYTFRMVNVSSSHPFYLCTNAVGGGGSAWTTGVNPTQVWGNQVMTFLVPQSAPATLYYACDEHDRMGWRLNVINPPGCYANCDGSTTAPVLNVQDFTCFLQRYAAGEAFANCDESTLSPVLNVQDFTCFLQRYAAGCP